MFKRTVPEQRPKASSKKALSKEQKMKMKKLKKKKELIELYKQKKISNEQFAKGMAKLGYSTDIEKAMEFKKYIQAQIQAFEKMDVSGAQEGGYHFDPNESKAQLPRDEHGNVITDFSAGPTRAPAQNVHRETYVQPAMVSSRPPPAATSQGGPLFGDSLFGGGRPTRERAPRKEVPKATLKRDIPVGRSKHASHRRKKADLEWDEEEEEEMVQEEEMEEEEFEIDLEDEDLQGESGWWDDDEWELDWSDEDEEEWEDWELDEDEEDEWEMWEEELEHPEGVTVEFEDEDEHEEEDHDEYYHDGDEEDDEEDVFDPREYYSDEEGDDDEDEEGEDDEDDDDWGAPSGRRRRRN
jgi:hypothetical protein